MPAQMRKHIHESNLIEGYDDLRADQMSEAAWNWLIRQPALGKTIVCKLQKRITLFQTDLQPDWRGYYRKIDVWIGGRKALAPSEINDAMNVWFASFAKSLSPKDAHIQFEKIHPFVDGNGRTGRMLMWWLEMKAGKEPTMILNSEKQAYYRWFKDYSDQVTALLERMEK